MKNLGKGYEIVDFSLNYADVPSPTGRYIVRGDGIYLSGTNIPVVTRQDMGYYFRGWYYDESGVVFQEGQGTIFLNFREYHPIVTFLVLFLNCACLRNETFLCSSADYGGMIWLKAGL